MKYDIYLINLDRNSKRLKSFGKIVIFLNLKNFIGFPLQKTKY